MVYTENLDYDNTNTTTTAKMPIIHIVLFEFKPNVHLDTIKDVRTYLTLPFPFSRFSHDIE